MNQAKQYITEHKLNSLQDLGKVTTAMKYSIYVTNSSRKNYAFTVDRAFLVLDFMEGDRKEHTKRWHVGFHYLQFT